MHNHLPIHHTGFLMAGLLLWATIAMGQSQPSIDSLQRLLPTATGSASDTTRARLLYQLAQAYSNVKYMTALAHAQEGMELAERWGRHRLTADLLRLIGKVNANKGQPKMGEQQLVRAKQQYAQLGDAQGVANCTSDLGVAYARQADYQTALTYFLEAERMNRQTGNQLELSKVIGNLGVAYKQLSDYPKALACHQTALQMARQRGSQKVMAVSLKDMGDIYNYLHQYAQAIQAYVEALALAEAASDTRTMASALIGLGSTYQELGQVEKALTHQQRALRIAEQLDDKPLITSSLNNVGDLYYRQGRPQLAMTYFERVVQLSRATLNNTALTAALINLAEGQTQQRSFERALHYYEEARQVSEQIGNKTMVARVLNGIADTQRQQRRLRQAEATAQRSLALSWRTGSQTDIQTASQQLATLYATLGQYDRAYQYQRQVTQAKDSLYNEQSARQIAFWQTRYETAQKEKQISQLRQQSQLQALDAQRRNAVTASLVSGLSLTLLLLGAGFYQYRSEKRARRLLADQKQAIETQNDALQRSHQALEQAVQENQVLLKEIHHRVKNNLQLVSSLLSIQARASTAPDLSAAIKISQGRVKTMALIHQNLYQSQAMQRVDMQTYLSQLVSATVQAFKDPLASIRYSTEAEAIQLDIDTATPIALITNELVSNALKYAFPSGRGGTLSVRLSQLSTDRYRLIVDDDGVGMPADVDVATTSTVGLDLVRTLTQQLEGHMSVSNGVGTRIFIDFNHVAEPVVTNPL